MGPIASYSPPTFESLPDEILVHILKYAVLEGIPGTHGASRRLNAVTVDQDVWREVMELFGVEVGDQPLLQLKCCLRKIELQIKEEEGVTLADFPLQYYKKIPFLYRRIQKILAKEWERRIRSDFYTTKGIIFNDAVFDCFLEDSMWQAPCRVYRSRTGLHLSLQRLPE